VKNYLARARRLYAAKKYRKALLLLEPEILNHQDDERYFLLLALCCMRTHNINDARVYLQRGLRINEEQRDLMQAMALCDYIQNRSAESIPRLLTLLDIYPTYKKGNALLRYIKDAHSALAPITRKNVHHLYSFFPAVRRGARYSLITAAIIVAGVALTATAFIFLPRAPSLDDAARDLRPGIEEIVRAERSESYIDLAINARYVLNEARVEELLAEIKREFLLYNDNLICPTLNRILFSNAHGDVKQRMLLLRSYLSAPTFALFQGDYSYADIAADPYLYTSCYVMWRGRVANVRAASEITEFDFLVGYESGATLDGIVRGASSIDYEFLNDRSYEVIAEVRADDEEIMLFISAIRPLE